MLREYQAEIERLKRLVQQPSEMAKIFYVNTNHSDGTSQVQQHPDYSEFEKEKQKLRSEFEQAMRELRSSYEHEQKNKEKLQSDLTKSFELREREFYFHFQTSPTIRKGQ